MSTDPSFKMTVEDVFVIAKRGTVAVGKVESGTLKVGDEITIRGRGGSKRAVVSGLEMFRKVLEQVKSGDNVGILLKDISRDDIQRGDELLGGEIDFSWKP
jgi:elongation factor Tu